MTHPTGRLSFRTEGDLWVAYYALPDTMKGAIFLGSIKLGLVQDTERKNAFMDIMKQGIGEFIEQQGAVIDHWTEQVAPEHERSGRA